MTESRTRQYRPGPPREGPVGARSARSELSRSLEPQNLPERPEPQSQAGKERVREMSHGLPAHEAEVMIEHERKRRGLDRSCARKVTLRGDGRWVLETRDGRTNVVDAMSREALLAWLADEAFV